MSFPYDHFRLDQAPICFGLVLFACLILRASRSLTRWKAHGIRHRKDFDIDLSKAVEAKKATNSGYVKIFPPSQRSILCPGEPAIDLASSSVQIHAVGSDYRLASPSTLIFSGFSIKDISRLGDFPDYARLSGVPLPSPLPNFEIEKAIARPYRPFRWTYHQTMSFKKLESDFWLELESTYRERISQRQQLFAKHGKDVLQAMPGSELACKELMEMVIQFLCARYPTAFQLTGYTFENHILQTTYDMKQVEPLRFLLNNVPEDFALTLRDETTGRYVLRAGVICSSIGWNLGAKMGLELAAVHKPVPEYKEKMEFSMDRFFSKMPTSSPIQRGSWGLSEGQPLHLPPVQSNYRRRAYQDPSLKPEDIYLRTDWQTLRRLPLSGAIVFSFKALFTPLAEFEDEPYIPSLLFKILDEGKDELMEHKGTRHVEHVAKPILKEFERRQIEKGLMPRDWEPRTLDESPFFPGWDRKWLSR